MIRRNNILIALVALALTAGSATAQLPDPGLEIDPGRTALVITDPQNDFLSPDGVTWGLVGKSVTENGTVENIETLIKTAKAAGIDVFVSPHYYYPTDHGWEFGGAVEKMMHAIGMFDRTAALSVEGFEGSGADWLERYKPLIEDGETIIASPHKVYGPETQRPRPAAAQARHRQGDPRRDVGQPVHRVAPARAPRAGLRGGGGLRRHRGGPDTRDRRPGGGADELPLPGEHRLDDGGGGRRHRRRRPSSSRSTDRCDRRPAALDVAGRSCL